jgi:hypothetical protein
MRGVVFFPLVGYSPFTPHRAAFPPVSLPRLNPASHNAWQGRVRYCLRGHGWHFLDPTLPNPCHNAVDIHPPSAEYGPARKKAISDEYLKLRG